MSLAAVLAAGGLGWAATQPGSGGAKVKSDTVAVAAADASPSGVQSLVLAGGAVYALAQDGSGIYKATAQDSWVRVGDAAGRIFGGGAGLFKSMPGAEGRVFRYTNGQWEDIGGPGAEFAVTDDALYGLTPDKTHVNRWTPETGWHTVGDAAEHIYGGRAGLFKSMPGAEGRVFRYTNGQWEDIGGPGAEFAVTDDALYGLTPDKTHVNRWTPETGWHTVGDAADHIYGGSSLLTTVPVSGDVASFDAVEGKWELIGGPGSTFISAGPGKVYGVWPDGAAVARRTTDGRWLTTGSLTGGGLGPSGEDKVERLNEFTKRGDAAFAAWRDARISHFGAKDPDPYGFRWDNNGCNVIKDKFEAVGFDFYAACARHDFGYRNYREALGEEGFRNGVLGVTGVGPDGPKARVDDVFKQDLEKECNRWIKVGSMQYVPRLAPQVALCMKATEEIFTAVAVKG
ncbi:phospholipase A2 [Streptomyces sp. NPDC006487]|uniref:phospholipase A2 n=1 Tax=Streptomyces sp. NPDC006487 TaxID=3364748 RepID=UPI0036CA6185